MKPHLSAVLQALFVVFLWATSWVFVKIGLQDIPPITFAGLRYFLAFLCLLIVLLFNDFKKEIKQLSIGTWAQLLALGLLFYAGTQGAIFVALAFLPAVTVNLLWSFSSVIVALLGIFWLSEKPTWIQWSGILLTILGAVLYFMPVSIPANQTFGVLVAAIGILANSISSLMGREINRSAKQHPLVVTLISMGIGSIVLLLIGLATEKLPVINLRSGGIILWLALVNTAFAFTLWNHTLRTLTAMESSIINGTMMIWIPILAILFLGETITGKEIIGLVVAGIGSLIVQLRNPFRKKKPIPIDQKLKKQPAESMTLRTVTSCKNNLFLEHPAIHFTLPIHQLFRLEPQRDFLLAVLDRVRSMGQVPPHFQGKVMSQRTRRGFGRTRGAHRLADGSDRVGSFPNHGHHRRRNNIRNQSFIKWFAFMNGIMSLGEFLAHLHKFGCNQTQAAPLET